MGLLVTALSHNAPMEASNHQSFHYLTSIFNSEIDRQLLHSPLGLSASAEGGEGASVVGAGASASARATSETDDIAPDCKSQH